MENLETLNSPLLLTGMMGAGKSAVAKQLGILLNTSSVDTDNIVEKKLGLSIEEIFAEKGEARFRDVEEAALKEALEGKPKVIATGGGIVVRENNRRLLSEFPTVYLRAEIKTLWKRVKNEKHRPLLKRPNPEEVLTDLLKMRTGFYEQAKLIIDVDQQSVDQITQTILQWCHGQKILR
jgi:shikimate kinase